VLLAMSSFAYGMLVRQQKELLIAGNQDAATAKAEENKLVTTVAALIPTEIVALHGLVLSVTTSTGADGSTTITKPGPLKWSLIVLVFLSVVVYLIGRGRERWKKPNDIVRAAIPACAVVVWAGIIGTSALTPWVVGVDPSYVVLCAGHWA
jgi:hypothetical protein